MAVVNIIIGVKSWMCCESAWIGHVDSVVQVVVDE